MSNQLTVFATYWNEKDWIEASLAQIDALDPREIIIVDGCFDPTIENQSTDGTHEIIEAWVKDRPQARLIAAVRTSRLQGLWYLFGRTMRWWNWPLRLLLMVYYSRTNSYRINQAVTFTKMLREATHAKPGDWVTHADCDQFYSDAMITHTITAVNDPTNTAELLTADEQTFFTDFNHYTTEYEKRNYNNLPYRIKSNTMIVPTRDVVSEQYPKPRVYGKDEAIAKQSIGTYCHYKFRPFDTDRVAAGYQVGDRKAPDTSKFTEVPYTGHHPQIITERFSDVLDHGA